MAQLAQHAGDSDKARSLALRLSAAVPATPGPRDAAANRARVQADAQLALGEPARVVSILAPHRRVLAPASLDVLARAYLALGEREKARAIVNSLTKAGYQHPAFLAFWRSSPLGGKMIQ